MPDESEVTPDGSTSGANMAAESTLAVGGVIMPAARLSAAGRVTVGDIRDAVQELRESSLDELRRLVAEYTQAHKAEDTTDAGILATKVEAATNMARVAHLLRLAAKWGIVTILASLLNIPVEHGVTELMGWAPPSITIVRQMSPSQMDELSRQIMHQLEQSRERQERR